MIPYITKFMSLRSLLLFIFEWPLKTSFTMHRGTAGIKCFGEGANFDIHESCNMFMFLNFYLNKINTLICTYLITQIIFLSAKVKKQQY